MDVWRSCCDELRCEVASVFPHIEVRRHSRKGQKARVDGSLEVGSKSSNKHALEAHRRPRWGSLISVPERRSCQIRKNGQPA